VTIGDALRLVIRGHAWLIVVLAILGALAGYASRRGHEADYTARARVEITGVEPKSSSESFVLASKAQAIATSRNVVQAAVAAAGTDHDPERLARKAIKLSSLGGSNVLQLALTDRDAAVSADLANALARQLVGNWDPTTHEAYDVLLEDLAEKEAALKGDIALIDGRIASLLQSTAPTVLGAEIAPLTAALAYRQDLTAQVAALEEQRRKVESDRAGRQLPRVIQWASGPAAPNPSGQVQTIVLTTLLGVLAATAIAGALEAIWPHVGGADAQAEALGGPSLGEFRLGRSLLPAADVELLGRRLSVAASARGVSAVSVVVIGQRGRWAKLLVTDSVREAARLSGLTFTPLLEAPPRAVLGALPVREQRKLGLAVVSAPLVRRRDLSTVLNLQRLSGGLVIGVATFERRPWVTSRARTASGSQRSMHEIRITEGRDEHVGG
jgi:hypothetical protein